MSVCVYEYAGVPGIITVVWVMCICNSELNVNKCWNQSFQLSLAWIIVAPILTALTVPSRSITSTNLVLYRPLCISACNIHSIQ